MVSVDSDLVDNNNSNSNNKTKFISDNTTLTQNASQADELYDVGAVTTPITPVAVAPSTPLNDALLPSSLIAAASLILRDKRGKL